MKTPAFWQSNTPISQLLAPLAWLYGIGARVDRLCHTPQRAPVPVISIGNATAGGTGKTPTAMALVPLLNTLGFTPHILTRGYSGSSTLAAHRVEPATDDWHQVGDEALLLARAAPTWVGRDRLTSAQAASNAGATVVICDDAHQHHRLHKDISLLVVDGPAGIGNARLLPAGPLREPWAEALARSHAVILIGEDMHHCTRDLPIPVFRASLQPATDTAFLTRHPWMAFAGIGRPEKFFETLREYGATLAATHCFPDHHRYRTREITALLETARAQNTPLITTEKDAVKLPPELRDAVQTLPIRLVLEDTMALAYFLEERLKPEKLT